MSELLLVGLDGSNPLGFLAALGTLRLCDGLWPGVRMRWVQEGRWRPVLSGLPGLSGEALCDELATRGTWAPLDKFEALGDNLTVTRDVFCEAARGISANPGPRGRAAADFLAAFGNEAFEDSDKGRIVYTDLSFITGSGHQNFLGTAKALQQCAGASYLHRALFLPWQASDKGYSFRWDPEDAKEYALRWNNPSSEGAWTVWGANRLAFEALPFYPMIPRAGSLRTTGFATRARAHEFTWPIWVDDAGADTVRSLVAMREIQEQAPDRGVLSAMGVAEVFRAQRVRIGQGANFKVSFRPARAV